MKFIERYVYSNHNSKSQSKTSERLSAYIEDNKKNILEYKIKVFVLDEKISAFAHKIKRENLGFDEKTNLFKNKPSNQLFNFSTQQIISKIGTGAVRRFGRKSFVLSDLESSKRRTNRRVSSLFGIELKNNKNTNLRLIKENLISLNCRSGK